MSTTTFARVATLAVRAPHDLVISLHLVHLMRNQTTCTKLMDHLIENPKDFDHFIDLLVPYGSLYLGELVTLMRAAHNHKPLIDKVKSAYERDITIIYRDCVRTTETGSNGYRRTVVTSEECWISFLAKCGKYPEMGFVWDIARQMTSPFGNKHFTPLVTMETSVAVLTAPVPAGMH